jgi:hypothetical protein
MKLSFKSIEYDIPCTVAGYIIDCVEEAVGLTTCGVRN